MNFDKFRVYFSANVSTHDKMLVSQVLNVRSSSDPEKFLGLPNMVGRRKKQAFQIIKDKMRKKINC